MAPWAEKKVSGFGNARGEIRELVGSVFFSLLTCSAMWGSTGGVIPRQSCMEAFGEAPPLLLLGVERWKRSQRYP